MITPSNFQEKSYHQHSEQFKEYSSGGKKEEHAKTWFEKDTVDAWRHKRIYRLLDPILTTDPRAKWLTVGDGRYGKDAKYILEKGCDALPTNISDDLLKEAKDIGYISEYKQENAESLSFNDSSFDYVLCKDSYHHFPRPMLALYEMLRVACKGVLLIEPNDDYINNKISELLSVKLKSIIKFLFLKKNNKHSFEDSGNYVYRISRREIEKVALGINCRTVAFKGINNAYLAGVEYEKIAENGPLQKKVKILISIRNFLCKFGFMQYGTLSAIIFKQEPAPELFQQLSKEGYEIIHLPDNPYISG